jgi:hypothetical protein
MDPRFFFKKYKGLRFFDEDEPGYYLIRSDYFTWKGKRAGGWVLKCDLMVEEDSPTDPPVDKKNQERIPAYPEPVEYMINDLLPEMIKAANQNSGVLLVAAAGVEGSDAEEELSRGGLDTHFVLSAIYLRPIHHLFGKYRESKTNYGSIQRSPEVPIHIFVAGVGSQIGSSQNLGFI